LLKRVVLRNYKSIAHCDVSLGPLTFFVGPNGAGKSNFIDALCLLRDALLGTLDGAIVDRGGIDSVRRQSSEAPSSFEICVEFALTAEVTGRYAIEVDGLSNTEFGLRSEAGSVFDGGMRAQFRVEHGTSQGGSVTGLPTFFPTDRLALVAASADADLRLLYDAIAEMTFYQFDPKALQSPVVPRQARLLLSTGENIASVIGHLERNAPTQLSIIQEFLHFVVPSIQGVTRHTAGAVEWIEFRQAIEDGTDERTFQAVSMSDGTLRALGVLVALFQSNRDFSPSLVAIEEPETALHPAASAALRHALIHASKQTQVLVTSHSPDLLDTHDLGDENLRAVVWTDGKTHIGPIDHASRDVIRTRLFTPGELLRMDQLVPDELEANGSSANAPAAIGTAQ
jgi:predicted ATPase